MCKEVEIKKKSLRGPDEARLFIFDLEDFVELHMGLCRIMRAKITSLNNAQ